MKDYKSTLYVAAGACSYGLTFLQFMFGFLVLLALNLLSKRNVEECNVIKFSSKIKLMALGISLGLTTTLYYLSIQYIPVSIGIILLMQSIWISLSWYVYLNDWHIYNRCYYCPTRNSLCY